jgi:hypothetical protein
MPPSRGGYLEELLTRLRTNTSSWSEVAVAESAPRAVAEFSGANGPDGPGFEPSSFTGANTTVPAPWLRTGTGSVELPPLEGAEGQEEEVIVLGPPPSENFSMPESVRPFLREPETLPPALVVAPAIIAPAIVAPAIAALPREAATPKEPVLAELRRAFFPHEPETLDQAHLAATEIENLILKFMLNRGTCTGRAIAQQIRLSFKIVQELMNGLRTDQLIVYKGASPVNDYEYQLTSTGRDQARRLYEHSTYFGSAPVTLADYMRAISAQSLNHSRPRVADLQRALSDLLIPPQMIDRLAQAIHHGRGLFLYGAPGNGKTSIAQRLTRAFGEYLWIPRAIGIDGDILRLFDPCVHEELPLPMTADDALQQHIDQRWIRIRRPTILAGGELTMERLDVVRNTSTGTNEAPLQLKSNCGTLVIDDFGRQRMSVEALLNRWIVPLDKGFDFLNLPSGRTIQVPFDQMLVFSTNLQPRDLADEAFLRRIPYKIDVEGPDEAQFRELLRREAKALNVKLNTPAVDYLVATHYQPLGRDFRCCHPRDLLLQVRNFCEVHNLPVETTSQSFDAAATNYFAVM